MLTTQKTCTNPSTFFELSCLLIHTHTHKHAHTHEKVSITLSPLLLGITDGEKHCTKNIESVMQKSLCTTATYLNDTQHSKQLDIHHFFTTETRMSASLTVQLHNSQITYT